MKFDYCKRERAHSTFLKRCSVAFVVYAICFYLLPFTSYASANDDNRVVRVGFFAFEGYHELDEQNQRSGYGYEYLHEMAKNTDWVFEYVDGTWEECQEMLKNGKIDLLTSAQYSEARDEDFDFSKTAMGTSYAQLTVSAQNDYYGRNEFTKFNGIHIGLLNGNSRNGSLKDFALEKGFTYRSTLYNTQKELDYALKTGAVDAVLTSNLRKLRQESVIAQFAPSPFYAIVKEGNKELLQEVDHALEDIEMNNPAFRYNLFQKYYRMDTTDTFLLSREEIAYLKTKPSIRVAIRSSSAPISYWENEKFQGISADVLEYLLGDLNVQVEYVRPASLEEGYKMLANGSADIACLFESDYNLAEKYNTRITSSYLKTNYSMVSRQHYKQNKKSTQTIAIPNGGLFELRYVQANYPNAEYISAPSNNAALEAVANGEADLALVNVYSVENEISNYQNLHANFLSDEEQQFSIGVSQHANTRLYSILDKKINTMSSHVLSDILSEHTMFQQTPMSLSVYFRQHPVLFFAINFIIFGGIVAVLLYTIQNNKRHAKSIYKLAYIDTLTKLWNINGFLMNSEKLISKYPNDSFAVVAIDLSGFSSINEDYGRTIGDKVIVGMGNMLNHFCNEKTVVSHADADHFLMLLCYEDQEEMQVTLTAISRMLSSYEVDNLLLQLHVYIGVGFVEQQEGSLLQAVDHANIARNECSQNQPVVYMDKLLQSTLLREKDIRDHVESALAQGEFQVYYQPKVDMLERKIMGAEALIRWNHSKLGFLSPAEFLPILEQTGLVTEIDFFVLEQTCKLVRKWLDSGVDPIIISVNQSRVHFLKSDYIERLQNMIVQYDIPQGHIELEITETLFGQETISNTIIKKMKSLGFLISIDDFGSGYSSLHLLHQISVDVLKIDKGLLDESEKEVKMRNIIRRVVQIASDLGVEVICEGVETKEQVEFLLGIDCKYAQGFLFSKPVPQSEFEALVSKKYI